MYLHPSLSFCELRGRHVFLDLPGDRYFCLAGELEACWQATLRDEAGPAELSALLSGGILVQTGGAPLLACPTKISQKTALRSAPPSSLLRGLLRYLAVRNMRHRLRQEPLGQISDELVHTRMTYRPGRSRRRSLAVIAADFARLDLVTTTLNQCLPRSLALAFHLIRSGYRPELVFAVRLGPFHAHCWVECDGLLINDHYERVCDYRPIRRI